MSTHNPKRGRENYPDFNYLLREKRLRRLDSKERNELIEYYKTQDSEDYERYIRWCKERERSTGKEYFH